MGTSERGDDRASQLVCPICQRQFSRTEHLLRHGQVHDKNKPHQCSYCNKAFARKDAAQRHEQGHTAISQTRPTRSTSLCRTCCPCAEARVKCSGGTPCNYCALRNLECTYRFRKQKRRRYDSPEDTEQRIATAGAASPSLTPSAHHQYSSEHFGRNLVANPASANQEDTRLVSNITSDTATISYALDQSRVEDNIPTASFNFWQGQISETNWLPFDQTVATASHVSSQNNPYHVQSDRDTSVAQEELPQAVLDVAQDRVQESEGHSSLRHDRVSALITSMRTSLPGLSSPTNLHGFSRGNGDASRTGRLYADGTGARKSQSDRRVAGRGNTRVLLENPCETSPKSTTSWIEVLDDKVHRALQNMDTRFQMPDDVYSELMSRICPYDGTQILPSELLQHKHSLLRKEAWEYFVQLYFDNFHCFNPFLDPSLLCIPVWGWALCLATAAIGVRYLAVSDTTFYGDTLCFALHNILLQELDFGRIEDSLPYIQARALSAIGLCHSSQSSLLNCGYNAITLVFNSCQRLRLLEEDDRIGAFSQEQDAEQVWVAWRFRETRRRTGLFIWIADCTLAYTSGGTPRLPLRQVNLLLPSSEELWNADTCKIWFETYGKRNENMADESVLATEEKSRLTVQAAVHELWNKLRAPKHATDFATTAIIHVLLRRMWETVRYFDDPLYSYLPASKPGQKPLPSGPSTHYIAAIPEFAKQRNSTCDCLDILHWDALSLSAKAGGHEGPVFLQLHLARLLTLTPVADLVSCVQGNAAFGKCLLPHDLHGPVNDSQRGLQTILIWTHEDRYKARLALIHAGAILWHVRRYPSESYVQPFAVYLAGIVLWAFGKYSQTEVNKASTGDQRNLIEDTRSPDQANTDDRMPMFLQLDRPIDDELVQYFIRSGERMRIYVEGVPDLCSPGGPTKILREIITLLDETSDIWTVAGSYAQVLKIASSAADVTD